MSKFIKSRSGYYTVFETDGTVLRSKSFQPDRDAILKRNQELQRTPGAVKSMDWGKLEFDIPITDWMALGKRFPGLTDPAHPDHKAQMALFMKSPEADKYRVIERRRGVNRNV